MSKLTIGIIGYGGHTTHHEAQWGNSFETVAVWDTDSGATENHPVRVVTEDEVFRSDADAVFIGSPENFHFRQTRQALMNGKHVFCEKPLLSEKDDLQKLYELFRLASDRGLVLTTCHIRRLDQPFMWLKHFIRESEVVTRRMLGDPLSFAFDFSYHEPSGDWKKKRSLLLDHANHEVDLLNFLFGIKGFDAWKLHDSHDHYQMVGRREDGITFDFMGTRRLSSSTYPEWCRVRFERGEVYLDMMTGTMHVRSDDEGVVIDQQGEQFVIDYDGRLQRVMAAFADEIQGGIPYLTEPEMLMNTEVGIALQKDGIQHVRARNFD